MKRNVMYFVVFIFVIYENMCGQTLVSGNVSGTWSAMRSPFVVVDSCVVPSGQSLTIEPGVKITMGKNCKINVFGQVRAVGTSGQPIVIKAPNDTTYWNCISIKYNPEKTSKFEYCSISNAQIGIRLYIGGVNATMITEISNCSFSKCIDAGVYGEAEGYYTGFPIYPLSPTLAPVIKNCRFNSCANGVRFKIFGHRTRTGGFPPLTVIGRGITSPTIVRNIFNNISRAALELIVGDDAGDSPTIFRNNTIVNSNRGILTREPYDVVAKNNIFLWVTTGVERSGALSSLVGFNCFFEKSSKNFIGYPATFGDIATQNRNGHSCDTAFNIFLNPLFVDSANFGLLKISPCIDAGDPNSERDPDGSIADIGANYFTVGVKEDFDLPRNIFLFENYPNPFNPETAISYQLPTVIEVELVIYNTLGERIRTLVNGKQEAAYHVVKWNGKSDTGDEVASGVYLYRLKVGNFVQTKRMLFMR